VAIIENAKVSRPGVCNAVETVLVDRSIADQLVPRLVRAIGDRVELRGDERVQQLGGPTVRAATEDDWYAEYLDLILAVRVVDGVAGAIAHIERYGSDHTESILTTDPVIAEQFVARSTPPPSWSTPRPGSPTAASLAWAPRSGFRRRGFTRMVRWAPRASRRPNSWYAATDSSGSNRSLDLGTGATNDA